MPLKAALSQLIELTDVFPWVIASKAIYILCDF